MSSKDPTVDEMFPSRFLKATDLPRKGMVLTIDALEQEDLNGEEKWVMFFVEEEKGLVLNKTNANAVADELGRKTSEWSGHKVHLRKEKVDFQGRRVDAIRLSAVEFDDEIPHTAPEPEGEAA